MQTATVLPAASILPSSHPQAKQSPTNVADATFNQVLAHQIQGRKNSKESEKTAENKTDSSRSAELTQAALSKEDKSESLGDEKNVAEATLPDTLPVIPVELLALVVQY